MPRTRLGVQIGAILAIVLLGLAIFLRPALEQLRQRKAVSELERGRVCAYQWQWDWAPSGPAGQFGSFGEPGQRRGDWIVGASILGFEFDRDQLDVLRRVPHLRRLRFVSSSSADAAIEGFSQLKDLELSGFSLRKSLVIRNCPNLRRVKSSGARTKVAISDLPQLQEMTLGDDHATGQRSRIEMSRVPNLRSLRLFHSALTDADLAKLDDLPSLEVLELRSTQVSAKGLAGLGRLPRLRELSLHRILTPAELQELQRALPGVIIESPFRLKDKIPPAVAIGL